MFVVQTDENRAKYRGWIGENGDLHMCDTPGCVCMKLLNDTPGLVDSDCGMLMGDISDEKS